MVETRKKIFYDVPEQLGELSVQSGFSGSLGLREKPSASDYEKLPGRAFVRSCRIIQCRVR